MQHKFKIIKSDAGFRVQFLYNKEVIFWTETYKGKPSAKKAIESIKTKGVNAETIEEDQTTKAVAAAKAASKVAVKPAAKKAPVKVAAKPAAKAVAKTAIKK